MKRIQKFVEENEVKYKNEPDYIQQSIKYMIQNYQNKITLQDIASHVGVTPTYLEFSFYKHTHFTIGDYLANVRLQHAQRELLISMKSVSQIAQEVGLSTSQNLIRLFKRNTGTTPLHYRLKQNQGYSSYYYYQKQED